MVRMCQLTIRLGECDGVEHRPRPVAQKFRTTQLKLSHQDVEVINHTIVELDEDHMLLHMVHVDCLDRLNHSSVLRLRSL